MDLTTFRICEINARFSWNGFMLCALGQQSFVDMGTCRNQLSSATDPRKVSSIDSSAIISKSERRQG